MRQHLRKIADGLISLSATIGGIALVFEVVLILTDVIGRFFGMPLTGAQDMSEMAMIIVVFGGMALCDKLGGHVAVDIFEAAYPAWLNKLVDILAAFLGALVFACLAWTMYDSSKISQMLHLSTNIIGLPKAYFQWSVCVFTIFTSFAMITRGIELIFDYGPNLSDKEISS